MRIESNLCHISENKAVVCSYGWINEEKIGSALGEAENVEKAEDNAIARLMQRLNKPNFVDNKSKVIKTDNITNTINYKSDKKDINLIKDSLRDILAIQAKMVTIGNIQRVVSDYYNIKLSDLLSKRRNRSITRPRQIAMSLAKELTNHSLPEIGEAFGGRDHTTVIHACEKTKELKKENLEIDEDYKKLRRSLSA